MKQLKDIKFNLSEEMVEHLVKFEKIKKELNELYNLDKSDDILLQIVEKEQELNSSRQKFIEKFRKLNKEEIKEYIDLRDK